MFTKENCPSPVKGSPEKAREQGRRGGLAKAARSAERKLLQDARREAMAKYTGAIEDMLHECDKLMKIIKKEILTPNTRIIHREGQPDEIITLPMSEGKIELALKFQKQLHEQVLGRPKQQIEGRIDMPITVVIHEEKEPEVKIIDVTPEQVLEIKDESGN